MRKVICYGFLTTMIALISAPTFAMYKVTPGISIMEQYNDNIFLDSENAEDDFITIISPHVALSYSSGKALELSLYYGLNFRFYDHHSNLNDEKIDEVQDILCEAHFKPSNVFFIDVHDRYDRVPVDIRRSSALDNVYENMTIRNMFEVSPYLTLPFMDTITATIGYRYTNIYYKEKEPSGLTASPVDSETHSAFLTIDKKLSPRIDGTLKYEYFAYRPDADDLVSDTEITRHDRHQASIAVDYKITSDIMITGEVGEIWFDYKTIDDDQEIIWNIGSDNIFRITESTSLGVDYGIHFSDSITSGTTRSQELNVHFKTGKVLKLEADPYFRDIKYLISERKDRVTGVTIKLSRPLSTKIDVSIDSKLEKDEFLSENEETRLYSVGSSLYYSVNRNMQISMGYRYNHQNASSDISSVSLDINDYVNNIAWLQARLTF